ncbi:GNAT family N-acetyltransferase [Kosakonia oryzendophytica]|uniref:GNAT family N-acetyltransferase n=1 Tax=Kosakonia oryzendophytica TaxID=1005665 RepID=UPI003D33B109
MTLQTPRFTLTPFQESDWLFFLRLRRDDRIMRYMAEVASEGQIRTLFDNRLLDDNAFVIRDVQHTAVGDIGLRPSVHNPQEADVGYSIMPTAQGRGVASEALQALCEFAFDKRNVQALNAWVLAENQGSVRVLEKSGFQRVQVLEKAYLLKGEYYDDWVYRREKGAQAR